MKKLTFLLLTSILSLSAVKTDAKPTTYPMQNCGGKNIKTISTNCKNQAVGFTLLYSLYKEGEHGSLLKLYNPTARNIEIDLVTLFNSHNAQCGLDSWGPEGETIYTENYYNIPTSECKPEQILKFLFVVGNKHYTFSKK